MLRFRDLVQAVQQQQTPMRQQVLAQQRGEVGQGGAQLALDELPKLVARVEAGGGVQLRREVTQPDPHGQ
jgi:hypothetical protein